MHGYQPREDAGIAGAGDEARAEGHDFKPEFSRREDLLLGQVLGGAVVVGKALGHLLLSQADMGVAVEIDGRRRQMQQAPHPLLQAGFDHILGDLHIGLVEVLVLAPDAHGPGAVHHGFDTLAEALRQLGVGQVALDELGATLQQVLHALGTATVDAHTQPLLQGEAGETPTDEPTRPRHQNLHQ
ncbi:hypothetical protein D3C84_746800 [compost metagenome]